MENQGKIRENNEKPSFTTEKSRKHESFMIFDWNETEQNGFNGAYCHIHHPFDGNLTRCFTNKHRDEHHQNTGLNVSNR